MLIDKHALKILIAASTERHRYALNGLHVRDGTVEATDGDILARVLLPTIHPDEVPASWQPLAADPMHDVTLAREGLVKVAKALPKHARLPILGTAAIGRHTEHAEAATGLPGEQTRVHVEVVEGAYPNIGPGAPLWPKGEPAYRIAISGRLLGVLAQLADRAQCVILTFRDALGAIEFQVGHDGDRPITGLVMPMRLPEPPRGDAAPPEPEPEDAGEPQDPADQPDDLQDGEPYQEAAHA